MEVSEHFYNIVFNKSYINYVFPNKWHEIFSRIRFKAGNKITYCMKLFVIKEY